MVVFNEVRTDCAVGIDSSLVAAMHSIHINFTAGKLLHTNCYNLDIAAVMVLVR